MVCNQCQELISEYIDGTLELGEQTKVENHLADCEPCRAVRDDLLQLVHFSRQLPLHTPSSAVWTRIRAQIEMERPATAWARARSWLDRLRDRHFDLSLQQLAASAAVLVLIVFASALMLRNGSSDTADLGSSQQSASGTLKKTPLSNAEIQQIEQRIDQLKESVEQRKVSWQPELRVAFDRNMYYVEQSLLECRKQLNGNPDDEIAQELMLNAYREKVRLLEGFEKF
ncbi:MAG TPA: anti-sigma factor [Blastocatellia bacterium]|nr:anti-sigma factor [Blastocatellia bacterium]